MKFNNLMNQKKYTISVGGSAVGAGVSVTAWAVSSDDPVIAASASFSAWVEENEMVVVKKEVVVVEVVGVKVVVDQEWDVQKNVL